jgi:hypothetical protein
MRRLQPEILDRSVSDAVNSEACIDIDITLHSGPCPISIQDCVVCCGVLVGAKLSLSDAEGVLGLCPLCEVTAR